MDNDEVVKIFKVDTTNAVTSINDLKTNIKTLKENLGGLKIGTKEYQSTLKELKENQNALKDAMYASSGEMTDLAKSAKGVSMTYNSLVNKMADLKAQLRATDVSTEEGRKTFNELAESINKTNNQLKEMDALQGNFQRNVGNYPGLAKTWAGALDGLDKGLKVTTGGVGGMKTAMDGLASSPFTATIGIIINLVAKLVGELSQNETAMESIKKLMTAMQPIFNVVTKALEKIAGWISKVVDYIVDLAEKNKDTFKNMVSAVVGVGNVVLQFLLLPIKNTITAVKGLGDAFKHLFKGEFKEAAKAAKDTISNLGDQFKNAFDLKGNFQKGKEAGEQFASGLGSTKKKVADTAKSVGKEAKDSLLSELADLDAEIDRMMEADLAAWEKQLAEANKMAKSKEEMALASLEKASKRLLELNDIETEDAEEKAEKAYQIQLSANEKRLQALEQYSKDALERGDLETYLAYEQEVADLEVEIQNNALREKKRLRELDLKNAKEKNKQQMDLMKSLASGTSALLSSIADMYEEDEKNTEKNANKIKAIRIASATIDTISGAIGAFATAAANPGGIPGMIIGAINAATITAAGIANIAKIKSTDVSSSSASSVGATTPAITSAPSVSTEVTNVRSVTSASEEERLNQMAQEQRVYILSSDIEASQKSIKTQVAESSF